MAQFHHCVPVTSTTTTSKFCSLVTSARLSLIARIDKH
jgi:hypothetical protein